ncbi:MAG TPA: TIGR03809 family protein [Xanthobacteraceae bacterium]|jgi:uncharacterized repeat protein (TIGR03809 family)
MAYWRSTVALDEAAQKWWALAERRRAHFVELYHTKRWKRYYREEQFVLAMREAIKASDRWAAIASTAAPSHHADASSAQRSAA